CRPGLVHVAGHEGREEPLLGRFGGQEDETSGRPVGAGRSHPGEVVDLSEHALRHSPRRPRVVGARFPEQHSQSLLIHTSRETGFHGLPSPVKSSNDDGLDVYDWAKKIYWGTEHACSSRSSIASNCRSSASVSVPKIFMVAATWQGQTLV